MPAAADPIVMPAPPPVNAPPGFHLLAKPSGSTCNIDCTYCFFLSKESLYPNDKHRMSDATLEAYLRQLLEAHRTPQVTVAWQGGEPTLMKLEFFQRAVAMRPNQPQALFQLAELSFAANNFSAAQAYLRRLAQVAPGTADVLWLGLRVERKLGNTMAEASYAQQLRKNFPESKEAAALQAGRF